MVVVARLSRVKIFPYGDGKTGNDRDFASSAETSDDDGISNVRILLAILLVMATCTVLDRSPNMTAPMPHLLHRQKKINGEVRLVDIMNTMPNILLRQWAYYLPEIN